jgi:hypothetical protein
MLMADHQESLPDIIHTGIYPGTNTAALSDKPRYAGAKQCVDPLDTTGSAISLVCHPMLPRREKRAIHFVAVRVNQLRAIRKGNHFPQGFQHRAASVADDGSNDLPRLSGARHPEPEAALLADAQLVYLKRIPRAGIQNRVLPLLDYLLCPFCRTFLTVSRLTLSKRAMPRCDRRSAKARSIRACFSSVNERSTGAGVKVFWQTLQRQRAVPDRLVPKRTTFSVS